MDRTGGDSRQILAWKEPARSGSRTEPPSAPAPRGKSAAAVPLAPEGARGIPLSVAYQ
jgi:hypothetical protein